MTRLYTDDVELYDIAFTWDIDDEVSWLVERFGPSCRTVLEPGSGTGRMLEALALRGLAPCGIDSSPAMVAFSLALRFEWSLLERDLDRRRERHRSCIEVLAGPREGYAFEEVHELTAWTSSAWRAAIEASPFTQLAAYDGGDRTRPKVELEDGGGLLWHELVAP